MLVSLFYILFVGRKLIIKLSISRRSKGFWHSFNGIFSVANEHTWHAWNLSYSASQFFITCSNNKTSPLFHNLYDTIIGICAFAVTWNAFKSRVLIIYIIAVFFIDVRKFYFEFLVPLTKLAC